MKNAIVILDNGAGSIKTGTITENSTPWSCEVSFVWTVYRISTDEELIPLVPNAIVRSNGDKGTYFGHEIAKCKDYSSLHYRLPFEKGYIVDWDAQKAIWDGVFSEEVLGVNTTESSLILTEPYFNLPNIQEVYDQFVFEEYEFLSYHRCTPASLITHGNVLELPGKPVPDCMVIVDSGFSFTHVVPIINGKIVWSAVKRLDVGGKLLTNQLKELVSFRQWNMMDETYIMNDVKESCCYVSTDFKKDIEAIRRDNLNNAIVQKYVLPDMSTNRKGLPEIIFRPDDIGLHQTGLASTIAVSISCLPEDLQPMFWENIGLIGGNTKLPGFRERLLSELQSLAPMTCEVVIYHSDESAQIFATKPDFSRRCVTRAEYLESGSNASRRKFRDWKENVDKDIGSDTRTKDDDPQPVVVKAPRGRPRGRLPGSGSLARREGR
ncbi:actin-related protein Arp6 [Gymnopus androsaceus JB14]|uniref:Actin-like protein ARP6 n=1 Tax=Gymnopus androsaceus JB14 TaxID=1447944 RepID=A0A6A4I9Q5_9AGAR|nr:actin-related protein Arp6 [Gymnopus androsaceus JB14]